MQIDQRGQEVVPGELEGEDGHRGHGRPGQREHDIPDDLGNAGAVDARGVLQVGRNLQEELAQQEDVEGAAQKGRQNQRPEGVDQVQLGEDDVLRDHHHRVGQHQRGQQQNEQGVLARRAQAGEAVGHHGAGQRVADNRKEGDDQGVDGVPPKRQRGQRLDVVLPARRAGPPDGRPGEHVVLRLERGGDHPVQRRQEEQGRAGQQQIARRQLAAAQPRDVGFAVAPVIHRCVLQRRRPRSAASA